MKQLFAMASAAILVGLASSGPAHAWINSKFSVGLNWSCQSGNNSFLWGVWRDGQIPLDGYYGGPPPGHVPGAQPFPWFGNANQSTMPQAYAPAQQPNAYAGVNTYNDPSYGFYPASYQSGYGAYQPYSTYTPSYYAPSYYNYSQNYYTPNFNDPYAWYYQR
jgi:hypothetical protein